MSVLKPYGRIVAAFQRLLDAGLIAGGLYAASAALEHEWSMLLTLAALVAVAAFALLGEANRLYGSWRLGSLDDEFAAVFKVWGLTCVAVVVGAFLAKVSSNYSRLAIVIWFAITPASLIYSRLAVRAALRRLRKTGRNIRRVAVAGTGPLADAVVKRLLESDSFGMRLAGVFDDRDPERIRAAGHDASRRAGTLAALVERARRGELDYVFIALPLRAEKRVTELVGQLADTTASVYVVPDLYVFDLMRARWGMLAGLPTISVYESPFDGVRGWLKRGEDLVLGTLFLALAALPMALIAAGVKRSTGGSVLFRQKRYGLNGRVVEVLKFRTMISSDDGPAVPQAKRGDARVTRFGRFLRSTSLDELPQLFNVLGGSMSLVGPRPHAVAHNEQYRRLIHGYMLRHKIRPGAGERLARRDRLA